MPKALRYLLDDVGHWISGHKLVFSLLVAAVLAAGGLGTYLALEEDEAVDPGPVAAPPAVSAPLPERPEPAEELETEELGFPAFATKNTTRVAGPDTVANAAGVALATNPSTGGVPGPDAVSLVDAGEWQAGIAAASLVADPVGAPILVSEESGVPALSAGALRALDPGGSGDTGGDAVFSFGAAADPGGDFDARRIKGENAAEIAAAAARVREELAGKPAHVLIASADAPEYAMPAAGWAARSGDPVLFAQRNGLPAPTADALERLEDVPVYVLGPGEAISEKAMDAIRKLAPGAVRIAAGGPTENSIAFARYADGTFGWNINDPGHGFVIASTERPLDAGAAAPLSASGTWGPLLVVEDGDSLPAPLRGYLLDLKPGYADDPTRALYNHVWLIGDAETLSVDLQAQVDELAEVAPITSGTGDDALEPPPGTGKPEADPEALDDAPNPKQGPEPADNSDEDR